MAINGLSTCPQRDALPMTAPLIVARSFRDNAKLAPIINYLERIIVDDAGQEDNNHFKETEECIFEDAVDIDAQYCEKISCTGRKRIFQKPILRAKENPIQMQVSS